MKLNEQNINVDPLFAPTYSSADAIGSETGFNYEIKPLSLSLEQPKLQYQPSTEKPFRYNPGDTVKGVCPYNGKEYRGIIQHFVYDNEQHEQPKVKLVYIFDLASSQIIPLKAESVLSPSQQTNESLDFNNIKPLNEKTKLEDLQQHRYKDEYKSALHDYVSGYTTAINDVLRKHKKTGLTDLLDTAIERYGNIDNIEVYRTVDWNYMKNIHGITQDNLNSFINKIICNPAYMSTSYELQSPWGKKWMHNQLVLHITGKTLYVDINKIFPGENEIDCHDQKEYLLPRETKLRLKSVDFLKGVTYAKGNIYMLNLEII